MVLDENGEDFTGVELVAVERHLGLDALEDPLEDALVDGLQARVRPQLRDVLNDACKHKPCARAHVLHDRSLPEKGDTCT